MNRLVIAAAFVFSVACGGAPRQDTAAARAPLATGNVLPGADAGLPVSSAADPECEGLTPPRVGAPNGEHTLPGGYCGTAVNGSGVLALQTNNLWNWANPNAFVDFVNPNGSVRARSAEKGKIEYRLLGRSSKFIGLSVAQPGRVTYTPETWDPEAGLISVSPTKDVDSSPDIVEDPLGGMAVLDRKYPFAVENYDELGHLRFRVELAGEMLVPARFGVDRLGNTLVLGDAWNKAVVGKWIDHDGNATTTFPLFPPQSDWNHLEGKVSVRLEGGFFIRADSWWQIDSLSTTPTRPPDWFVASNPDDLMSMQPVHGGRGYALVRDEVSSTDCVSTVEVMTATGKSCGKVSTPGHCAWISIGYDGTLVQQVTMPVGSGTGELICRWHWWSGLFR